MIEISIGMDYLFETQRINKLKFNGRGLLDDSNVKNISVFQVQDGKIMHHYLEVDEPLYAIDLCDSDLCASEYIDADEELSDVLNDNECVLFSDYKEI